MDQKILQNSISNKQTYAQLFNVLDKQDVMFLQENVFVYKDGLVQTVINKSLAHLTK